MLSVQSFDLTMMLLKATLNKPLISTLRRADALLA
jgi:hypothetical protein